MGFCVDVRSSGIRLITEAGPWRFLFKRLIEFPKLGRQASCHPITKDPEGHEGGFTLLELLLVMAILMALAGIAIPVYSNQIMKAKIFRTISEITTIQKEIDIYKEDNGSIPANLVDIGRGNLMDPWGNPYQYANHSLIEKGKRRKFHGEVPLNMDYDLFSMGPDGDFQAPLTAEKSRDDIVRADDGGYVGPASQY